MTECSELVYSQGNIVKVRTPNSRGHLSNSNNTNRPLKNRGIDLTFSNDGLSDGESQNNKPP